MASTLYTTMDGDRWDTIAYKAYGDATQIAVIIAANTTPITDTLPGGIDLIIPIVEIANAVSSALLPPWKRVTATPQTTNIQTALNASNNLPGSHDGSFD